MSAVDDAPDCVCGDPRAEHRRGAGGCRNPECGCGKFDPPGRTPAGPVLDVSALLGEVQADVDREAELTAQLAEVEQERDQLAQLVDQKQTRLGEYSDLLTASRVKVEQAERERDANMRASADAARKLIAERDGAAGRWAKARAEIERLEALLLHAEQHSRDLQDDGVVPGEVLYTYAAWQCIDGPMPCGRRYTRESAALDHACGPMGLVTVTVSRRLAPDTTE